MQNQEIVKIIENLKGRRNYEEKKASKLGFEQPDKADNSKTIKIIIMKFFELKYSIIVFSRNKKGDHKDRLF